MAMKVETIDIWTGEVRDQPGGLAGALRPIVAAGASFSFVIGHRRPEKPGTGVVFFGGVRNAAEAKAAELGGFAKSDQSYALRIEAPDKPGLLEQMATQVADAGINLRAVSAAAVESRAVFVFAFDSPADRDKAASVLTK